MLNSVVMDVMWGDITVLVHGVVSESSLLGAPTWRHGIKLSKDFRLLSAPHKPRQVIEHLADGALRETFV